MLVNESKDLYTLKIPIIWDELEDIKKRIIKLKSKSNAYDILCAIRNISELDELIKQVREELQKYGVVFVTVENHDN